MWKDADLIPYSDIKEEITPNSVVFAKRFGEYLGDGDRKTKLTTSQLRKFFGEIKKQQMNGWNRSEFILLKPKLAYAVGRAEKGNKIKDFYMVIANAIDQVENEKQFNNFVKILEAIVAYHKAKESGIELN